MLVSEVFKENLLDVNVLRRAGGGLFDHYLVVMKLRFKTNDDIRVEHKRASMGEPNMMAKVGEVSNETCQGKYQFKNIVMEMEYVESVVWMKNGCIL